MAGSIRDGTHVVLNDGHLMPLLGLGTSRGNDDSLSSAVEFALKNGYTHVDTAYMYLNEEAVGEGIHRWGGDRKDIFVTTKLPTIGMGGGKVEHFLRKSLQKLGLDYVDLYLIHAPFGLKYVGDDVWPTDESGQMQLDYNTNHISLWKEMEAVREAGLARSIGVSNFTPPQLRRLLSVARVRPAVNQVELHVEFQQKEMQKFCREEGIVLTSYATLGSPGRRNFSLEGCVIPSLLDNPVVLLAAKLVNRTPAQVLLRYFLQQGIVVIPKSVTPARIIENSQIFGWSLPDEAMSALGTLDKGEKGRSFTFSHRKGLDLHPEYFIPRALARC